MKLSILSALLAITASASVSAAPAYSFSGTIYVYANSIPHPKTTFLKKGSGNNLLTDGVACKGSKTLPGKGDALKGTFTTVKNQWDFNGEHDNEIRMGYVQIDGNKCLSLIKGSALSIDNCPSFSEEIKVGNKFAWFHDTRNSAIWAYGGDANAEEHNGVYFDAANLQTNGKTLKGTSVHSNSLENVFIGLGYVGLGGTGKGTTGCQ
ncbi:hypothetical protein INT43_001611 [Umbelopsis isabellina]|uniref:Uncharacterized protein n=1 Tax=Mortierella isabellina TaxID=91625 RepID=A0A8H7PRU6_MORIS|nr:hypothetical protein INT43_001611 [Umbelopsis isabellina]